ncbi:hypothetical protein FJQ98_25230 [Lysinibacillus agricola]|uniref:Uncharacterized protein n=1 Tax=Lysinibacillus agricola TaxID=2590012 RepID=A0ABX7AVW0_9BACI|nr:MULTISPECIES: hypothetical protein [Lysinibacillus]KOS61636.1 hypothetical protein AN161_16755 [Lysinibacillus sp. FJAT-14222]QQP12349.1 hypothetical protein FJQ98_25230 [Lysinibacillus agricola]
MANKFKAFILTAALLITGVFALPTGAFADSNYNATVQPGEKAKLATESMWLSNYVQGSQNSVYANGNCGVTYIITDSNNNTKGQKTVYGNDNSVNITFDLGSLGETLTLWGKNIYNGARDAVKLIGKWLD